MRKFILLILFILSSCGVSCSQPVTAPGVFVQEEDGAPNAKYRRLLFPDGSLTDNTDGSVSVANFAGGTISVDDTYVAYADGDNTLSGNSGFFYNKTSHALTAASFVSTGAGTSALNEGLIVNEAGGATATDILRVEGDTDVNLIYTDTANNRVGIGVATPQVKLNVNGAIMSTPPSAQTIAATNTIAADACGGMKQITASGAVTTNTTDTFTAPAAANTGCCMDVVNVGAQNITLDNNTHFKSIGGADIVMTADDSTRVCSNGTTWYSVGSLVAN